MNESQRAHQLNERVAWLLKAEHSCATQAELRCGVYQTQGGVTRSDYHSSGFSNNTDRCIPLRTSICQRSIPALKADSLSLSHAHAKTHTLTAYTTFVTSHTLVISKDTKPTRSPTQFPRMQRKWSCKQALSLTGKKGTEKNTNAGDGWREIGRAGGEGGKKQEVDFYLTHSLSSLLYNILRQGFAGKVRTLWMVHTNAPPPYPDRKRHNEPSVLSARGGHAQKSTAVPARFKNVLVGSQSIWNNTPQLTILYVTSSFFIFF